VEPAPAEEPRRRRRHTRKPGDREVVAVDGNGRYRSLIASGGRAAGLTESDLISAVHRAGLDGEAIRNVRLLERFVLLDVPEAEAERVVEAVDGSKVGGVEIRLEAVRA
jgi:ATP-dependent RNA helicase DeaD